MADYVSKIKSITRPQGEAYATLSDLRGIEQFKKHIPESEAGKIDVEIIDSDSCAFIIPMAGKLILRIVEREPEKTVKLEAESSPIPITIWLQLVPASEMSCCLRLTLRTELNFMMKKMIGSKLQEAVEKLADILALAANVG